MELFGEPVAVYFGVLDLDHSGGHGGVVLVEQLELGDGDDVPERSDVCLTATGERDKQLGHVVGGGAHVLEQLTQPDAVYLIVSTP